MVSELWMLQFALVHIHYYSMYSICRHVSDDKGRTHELEQSAVKCMRGILFCYMRQSEKVIVNSLLVLL